MSKIGRENKIAFSIVLGVLTIISAFCVGAAVSIPPPHNGAPIFLAWVSGIAIGMYLVALMMNVREK